MFGNAIDKLAKLAGKNNVAKILSIMEKSKDDKTILACIDTLGKCKGDEAFNGLVPLIRSASAEVRKHAAEALGALGQPRGKTFLTQQYEMEKDEDVKKAFANAMAKLRNAD